MAIKLITTSDGSHSLFHEELNETYHSTHGAEAESRHVFLDMGLQLFVNTRVPIRILEVGFGTGLNALLTLEFALKHQLTIVYHSLEPYPLPETIFNQLNYCDSIVFDRAKELFLDMHLSKHGEEVQLTNNFLFCRHEQKLEHFYAESIFDLIYFDAFAPNKQVDMWTLEQMQHLYRLIAEKGCLVSYCAQGQFKRNLKAAGFSVEELPGPPMKKQMTRGRK